MAEAIAFCAMAIEGALGWPAWLHRRVGHPVGAFAALITACDRRLNLRSARERTRRAGGCLTVCLLLLVAGGGAWLIEQAVRGFAGIWSWPVLGLLAWPAMAARSLDDHVRPIHRALRQGDLEGAREAVGRIVGRDTTALDQAGVARAAIESLAESFCDGVVAPLFWLLVLGLPGAWIYKALNTADSMIGHREVPYTHFGWAAARSDDLANLLPARLSGLLLCLAALGGLATLWRDHARHASPNAGWPEAAMAGALSVRLAGPIAYDGELADKPWIGQGGEADAAALARAMKIYRRACALLGAIVLGAAWLG
ncbi:adenosylcobinamide-phosphate synthase CbiB [Novosphingobium pentaromativorans]|uniref:Cobalamin biosynthesis protein CobD n=1 Tax=Novosphingobium pentaromativorans US6-1 TaxID=1088721 RepID=G6EIV7_9SPHN|nr:adenosylcobinamide-phosphate synthase CbiB [Novosphingobium pentaromativorans]AIT78918.1 adenosylcobinamide-phosphate synthase [Novosphingobium pentaromativorans US6-1]EHJ58716.1 adenosylcobinamide-phosphate synthase CobD [Novosphingobium pentaromativorans US6-1]